MTTQHESVKGPFDKGKNFASKIHHFCIKTASKDIKEMSLVQKEGGKKSRLA